MDLAVERGTQVDSVTWIGIACLKLSAFEKKNRKEGKKQIDRICECLFFLFVGLFYIHIFVTEQE